MLPVTRTPGSDPMPGIFDAVFEMVDELTESKRISCFFFVRKPPGLRLRFLLSEPGGIAEKRIKNCCDVLVGRRIAERWFASVYEAETFKLGGPEAVEAVHSYFSTDSRAWWRWGRMAQKKATVDARLLSLAVLNDLFLRFLEFPEEIWDVWCRVTCLHGARVLGESSAVAVPTIERIIGHLGPEESAILHAYASANTIMATRFSELHEQGRLLFAYRFVLPHVALYHWNRYGFTPSDRTHMFNAMTHAWSPHAVGPGS
ncbi:thiopeptide-type bacteriocin biosynthesis protein [Streptomyces sp. NBC_00425]|uniref:thiopeptide-type bacteriocin biosynthesis protein n=1 Tax=Streptomyces sp. NBC_00425 TaxID=2975740 RepID=UPI002E227C09